MSDSTGQLQIGTGLLPDQALIGPTTKETASQCIQKVLLRKRPVHSFRRGGMLHLSPSAYNEIQKVVAKDHFSRHLNELTFRRWDDFAEKLHTFRRCERPERKENAADAVADMARILTFRRWDDSAGKLHTFRRWDDFAGKLHTFRRWERPERKENAATDAVADMARILTFRRWDDFAGKLHTFRRCERPGEGGRLLDG